MTAADSRPGIVKGQVDRVVLNNKLNATDEHSDELAEVVETVRFLEEE